MSRLPLMNQLKEPRPTNLMQKVPILVDREPDKKSFAHNVVLGDKTPVAGIKGVVAVFTPHEVKNFFGKGFGGAFFIYKKNYFPFFYAHLLFVNTRLFSL